MTKLDNSHQEWTNAHYMYYVTVEKGKMKKGRDLLYSKCKQSGYSWWVKDQGKTPWGEWESTGEYDTEVADMVESLCERLQAQVMQLQNLEIAHLPGSVIAEVVSQVVPPVAGAPTPAGVEVMDMTA